MNAQSSAVTTKQVKTFNAEKGDRIRVSFPYTVLNMIHLAIHNGHLHSGVENGNHPSFSLNI